MDQTNCSPLKIHPHFHTIPCPAIFRRYPGNPGVQASEHSRKLNVDYNCITKHLESPPLSLTQKYIFNWPSDYGIIVYLDKFKQNMAFLFYCPQTSVMTHSWSNAVHLSPGCVSELPRDLFVIFLLKHRSPDSPVLLMSQNL